MMNQTLSEICAALNCPQKPERLAGQQTIKRVPESDTVGIKETNWWGLLNYSL